MCGIAGWFDSERDLTNEGAARELQKMVRTLTHRGPDASAQWLSTRTALGHRRLIVVDPAGGAQPMVRKQGDNEFVIIYNGELYNTPELRLELIDAGYTFQSHSDTEVLLNAFIHWGSRSVEKLNGIFAFAVWDVKKQSLFLARDRFGVKPLFYTKQGSAFLFASELKALLAHDLVEPAVDVEGLAEVFAIGPARTPGHGVFRGIKELKPGYMLELNEQSERIRPYWQLISQPHEDDLDRTTDKVAHLLEDAVTRQLVADVPVCTFLSGGLDSSALTAFAARKYQQEGEVLHTFSIDYSENDRYFKPGDFQPDSDRPWIERVSQHFGTEHHYVTLEINELTESLYDAMRGRDLPGMADVDSSLLLFCKEIKKEATVGLSGECADEVFGGYPWFHRKDILESHQFPWSPLQSERFSFLSASLRNDIKPENYLSRRYWESIEEVPKLIGEDPMEARRREISYLNIQWFMANLLDRKDRMSMATGLEVRVPFCDHRLVEYAWNIPWHMKAHNGREKGLLRRALTNLLPEDVIERKKSPYPKTHHPAYRQAVMTQLREVLHDNSSPLLNLVDRSYLLSLLHSEASQKDAPERPWFGQLMTLPQFFAYLLQVNMWLREYGVKIC
ncbi:asparagine synthase (glutamine-hydrolyzing) [Heliorestis acidaminivorans]|uniref:asparagine synthase (glutamine-hydrolyzing) n=1 Tax=Heliorestis acidaminivorans TaxID=553427 RepID=A0A6I0EYW0_9FIRM|nr:asparagine synthase (glutamine-hydrolyzing) [Heliorestis acidaminivorans]KAB2952592.1 asparagine synthase (glutamine-hydrolyzing) [Heliorestis acidaminivorans]